MLYVYSRRWLDARRSNGVSVLVASVKYWNVESCSLGSSSSVAAFSTRDGVPGLGTHEPPGTEPY